MGDVIKEVGNVLDFGTGAYSGITGGATDWLDDPTGKKASERALQDQLAYANRALDTYKDMYDQQREDLQPWHDVGEKNLNTLDKEMGGLTRNFSMDDFHKDPGYQFRLDEAMKAMENSAAARGSLQGTNTMRDLVNYSQNYASNEYQNAYNRFNQDRDQRYNKLANLAGMGQVQSGAMANAAGGYGQNVANTQIGMGNAHAGHQMGIANFNRDVTGKGLDFVSNIGGMAMMSSDERLKTNITPISKEEIKELREKLKPYFFEYKDKKKGDGLWAGIMAQDLEKTKVGKRLNLVKKDADGFKTVDLTKLCSLMLASLGEAA